MAMTRRCVFLNVMAVAAAAGIAGCESLRQATRSQNQATEAEAAAAEADSTKIQAVDSDPKKPQPFFKNNRLTGGWSSEAREIESHLGVGP